MPRLRRNRYRTHELGDSVLIERGVASMVGRTENTRRRIAQLQPRTAQLFVLPCGSGGEHLPSD